MQKELYIKIKTKKCTNVVFYAVLCNFTSGAYMWVHAKFWTWTITLIYRNSKYLEFYCFFDANYLDCNEQSCSSEHHAEEAAGGAAGRVGGQRGGNDERHAGTATIAVHAAEGAGAAVAEDV